MHQNPNPRTFAELTAILEDRNRKSRLRLVEEKEKDRLAHIAKTYERLAGED